ncbi:hypothetical protein FACS1894153_4470 [Bacteroidia bacterium]|nr:hypothetical protein FACS1894153_4470 [Bacteroidia bacterium]
MTTTPFGNLAIYPSNLQYLCGWVQYEGCNILLLDSNFNKIDDKILSSSMECNDIIYQTAGMFNTKMYDSISELNKDVHFAEPKYLGYGKNETRSGINIGFNTNIISINIKSDKAFDEYHSIGQNLNDIVQILSLSSLTYIESNYKQEYNWSQTEKDSLISKDSFFLKSDFWNTNYKYYQPICRYLSEITTEEMQFMYVQKFNFPGYIPPLFYLHFTQEPTISKTHNLTVTITLRDGRIFEKSIEKTFN